MRGVAPLLVVAGLFSGCITPSIPIPPPDPSDMTFDISVDMSGSSNAILTYPANANYTGGTVYVANRSRGGVGVFQPVNADSSIGPTMPLPAGSGDEIVVSVGTATDTVSTCIVLRQGTQDPNADCTF
ncbi:MAG TPA: hypothetical protein VGG74_13010 [Kofleriaceae bacterium]|jgi:hypothetical protein